MNINEDALNKISHYIFPGVLLLHLTSETSFILYSETTEAILYIYIINFFYKLERFSLELHQAKFFLRSKLNKGTQSVVLIFATT